MHKVWFVKENMYEPPSDEAPPFGHLKMITLNNPNPNPVSWCHNITVFALLQDNTVPH